MLMVVNGFSKMWNTFRSKHQVNRQIEFSTENNCECLNLNMANLCIVFRFVFFYHFEVNEFAMNRPIKITILKTQNVF